MCTEHQTEEKRQDGWWKNWQILAVGGHLIDAARRGADSQRVFCRRRRDYLFIYFAPRARVFRREPRARK